MSSTGGQLIVLHQGALGDFVLTLSLVQAVRDCLNPNRVVAIASAASARLAAGRSVVDSCVHPDSLGLHTLFGGELNQELRRTIEDSAFVLSFLGGAQEPVSRRLREASSTSPEHAEHRLHARGSSRVICVDPRPTPETLACGKHIAEQWADAIRAAGLAIGDPRPPVIRPVQAVTGVVAAPAGAKEAGGACVLFHPGSGGRGKCWPLNRFIALASQLGDVRVQWLLGPVEVESGLAAVVQRHAAAAGQRVMLSLDLEQAAEVIAGAAAYVGNDAGMTHLAAALGIPTLALFLSTDPRVWRPLGDHVTVVTPGDGKLAVVLDAVRRLRG